MTRSPVRVFLFAGQSNIAGADAVIENGTSGFTQQEADKNSLFTYGPGPGDETSPEYVPWGSIKGHVVSSGANPHGFVIGPEVGFCRDLFEKKGVPLAIIKCCGNIKPMVDAWLWSEDQAFFRSMTNFVSRRWEELQGRNLDPVMSGVVWDQGIDDGFHEGRAREHGTNLRNFIGAVRNHFNNPKLPVALTRSILSPLAKRKLMETVRKAQVEVASSVDQVKWLDVDDLETICCHHLSAASQLKVGQRFAKAHREMERESQAYS
jgi:Carbohydrate esterase, sialic acid-specific acetylesterase